MSIAVYPTLPGLTWSVTKSPIWKTRTQTSVRGREVRIKDQIYPRWKFQLVYSFLRGMPGFIEIQTMLSFFQSVAGSWDTFLFDDPTDDFVTGQTIGIGDGANTSFQLARQFAVGGFNEPITAPGGVTLYLNGALQTPTAYGWDGATGLVTFIAPPSIGVVVTADIGYWFRCRFTTDTLDFEQFMSNWWELKKIEFESVLL